MRFLAVSVCGNGKTGMLSSESVERCGAFLQMAQTSTSCFRIHRVFDYLRMTNTRRPQRPEVAENKFTATYLLIQESMV